MSAGTSSQLLACLVLGETKVEMWSRSSPAMDGPQLGAMSRAWYFSSASRRIWSIQSGSSFFALMARTMSGVRPSA